MALLDLVFPSRRIARWNALVDQVAGASVEAVCRRVELRAGAMTPAEARGYIRARSAGIVHQKADYALAHRPTSIVARREALIEQAREEVVRRVMGRVRTPIPAVYARRKAA